EAATDTPIAARYKELDLMFPNSKFILTVRELGSWLAAFKNWRKRVDISTFPPEARFEFSWVRTKFYGSAEDFTDEKAVQAHLDHIADVGRHFKDRRQDLL